MPETDGYSSTSERLDVDSYLGNAHAYLIYLFHISAYDWAARRLPADARVLDYGCGTGYGSFHLAESGHSVTGVDVSAQAVSYATDRYHSERLDFRTIQDVERQPLPFDDESFDAVLSFQVIEHVPSVDAYLTEATRVLRPGGTFLCATPDRTSRLYSRQRPWNRWHLEEFTESSLAEVVSRHLRVDEVMGMTAPVGVVDLELKRTRRLRIATLPFTFPGSPEPWRVFGLEAIRRVGDLATTARFRLSKRRSCDSSDGAERTYAFGVGDIVIASGAHPSTNVVLVAGKPPIPAVRE